MNELTTTGAELRTGDPWASSGRYAPCQRPSVLYNPFSEATPLRTCSRTYPFAVSSR